MVRAGKNCLCAHIHELEVCSDYDVREYECFFRLNSVATCQHFENDTDRQLHHTDLSLTAKTHKIHKVK